MCGTPSTDTRNLDDPLAADARRLPWWAVGVILLYGGTLLGIGLGRSWVLTYHEVLLAEPAREMAAGGDWIVPRFAGRPCTHKPPLLHWAIAGAMVVTGSDAEWVCRLPSVLAALATALLIAALAARWHGRRVGLVAGLVQLSAFYVLMQARLAETDMLLCLTVTAALAAFAVGCVDPSATGRGARAAVWGFYAAVGLSALTKSLIGLGLIAGGCGAYILIQRDWRALRRLVSPVGWAILAALVLPWPIAAGLRYPGIVDDWHRDTFRRFAGGFLGTGKPWAFYLYMIPALLLPWTLWLPAAVRAGRRDRLWQARPWRLLAAWVVAGTVLLTVSRCKFKHYAIPILPPLSVLIGYALARRAFGGARLPFPPVVSGAAIVAACAAAAVVVAITRPALAVAATVILAVCAILLTASVFLERRRQPVATLACMFAAAWAVGVGVRVWIMPQFDVYRDQAAFARRVSREFPAGEPLYVVGLPEIQVTYYLRPRLVRFDRPEAFTDHVRREAGGIYHVLAASGSLPALAEVGTVTERGRCPTMHAALRSRGRLTWAKLTVPAEGPATRAKARR